MRTTVVIPAYRAWSTLPTVLDCLEPQLGGEREVLLVDSAANGAAPDYARRWPWLRVISVQHQVSPGKARNLGAAQASGELLAFLDADAVPAEDWLDRLEAALTDGRDAVAGAIANGTPDSRIGTAEYLLVCSETFPRRPRPLRHGLSGNLLVRKAYFDAVGGFHDELRAGEDTVLTFPLASRQRLGFASDARVDHVNRTKLRPFLANQRIQGAAFVAICRLVPYPYQWLTRRPALWFAGPLRLVALARCVLHNPPELQDALRSFVPLVLGTVAWASGALKAGATDDPGAAR